MHKLKIAASILFVLSVGLLAAKILIPTSRSVRGVPTEFRSTARPAPAVRKPLSPPSGREYRMAIILDDWGTNLGLTRQALEIDRPLTLSIIPHLEHSKEIAEVAHKHGLGVMLHMPMEPKKARERMEPQTILTSTPDADVVRFLNEALAAVPHTEGMNNHTGSKATCDRRVMKLVLGRLKELDLFFVDSVVTAETVGSEIAKETGVRFIKRNVFIDNKLERSAIIAELERAKNIAVKNGQVVVIGHDKKKTLAAIKEAVPELEAAGVRLVLVKDLIKGGLKK